VLRVWPTSKLLDTYGPERLEHAVAFVKLSRMIADRAAGM
jgi:hypothetical protein